MFKVPSEALALAVATEWNSQDKIIKRNYMHLVSLSTLKQIIKEFGKKDNNIKNRTEILKKIKK